MGVPKFFRYTSERYPCLNELVKQYQIPDFDNMYLDMNGIIHNCSHPNDSDPHFRITEEKIFQDIFHYLSILFQIVKPKKLFFMAIDGVAPRAKMNQQRGRRFRSAREAEKLEEEAKAKGEVLPSEKRFDSNCITPGTVFMARLHEQLRYFVQHKMTTDPQWSKVKVILSGHETPGEGEHKIMDYIRWARSQPDYDPNTRHCLYGLDADLIMLGMCTHEPHFALLREEVKFGKTTQRATSPEETNFYLLHLSLLREYLEQEFISIKDKLLFEYDLEKIVDDWVLMGFLVGNDFIPNLPNMHIGNEALPILYNTYMKVLPTLDGYINEAGDLNLARFEVFMQELAKLDKEKFQDVYADLKYFEAKTGRRPNAQERKEYKPNNDDTFNVNVDDIKNNRPDDELQALINATQEMFVDDMGDGDEEYEETSDEEANMEMEFILHKKDYYMNKLDYTKVTDEVLAGQAEGYVRAIQWNLFYYYKGCPSWCWYYPHHYAPYISDIKGFKDLKIEFELGEPFKPFEQLLAVLPAASRQLLPTPFHSLMTQEDSAIVHYYPLNFETDLNGKRNDWEAVVLIPFIDETNLLSAMMPCYQRLSDDEIQRNTHGPMLVYNWTATSQGRLDAADYFPPILENHAIETKIWRQELDVPAHQLKRGMLPNAYKDMLFPGFPTMRHLKYKTTLKKGKVRVFDQPSRNENMIVQIIREPDVDETLHNVAQQFLGKVIWVGWPHLTKAKVISVSNEKMRLHHVEREEGSTEPKFTSEANTGNLHKQWISERSTVIEHNMNRLGVDLDVVNVLIHAVNLRGYKYIVADDVRMVQAAAWCSAPCGYALQAVLRDARGGAAPGPPRACTLREAFPPGDTVFLLTQGQYYGCQATVMESESGRSGRIKVQVKERTEPSPAPAAASHAPYRAANHAAALCGVSTQMLSRITGSVLVIAGPRNDLPTEPQHKVNIGLNLKFNKKNEEVAGYTRRCAISGAWTYSERCVALLRRYQQQFPALFDRLARVLNHDVFFEADLWPDNVGEKKQQEVAAWLKTQPHGTAARRECGSQALEPEDMRALWLDVRDQLEAPIATNTVTLHVKWNLLYKAELNEGNLPADPAADFRLLDRVVCVARVAPGRGARGTLTAVLRPAPANTVRLADKLRPDPAYQIMFDEPFPGGMTEELFDEPRFYRMLATNMLNISYGRKLRSASASESHRAADFPQAPSLLRRDQSHHSAFANYSSPTNDMKAVPHEMRTNFKMAFNNVSPVVEPKAMAVAKNGPIQDNGTHLLKSLLKISEDDSSSKKSTSKNKQDQNWRKKAESSPQTTPPQPAQSLAQPFWEFLNGSKQQQNWRKEISSSKQPPPPVFEWTNSNLKMQAPPVPPFPSFPPPFPPPGAPRLQDPPPPRSQPPRPQVFPVHLPTVASNIALEPSWVHGQSKQVPPVIINSANPAPGNADVSNPPPSSVDKLSNPFVPLQVQTSRRRIQNTSSNTSVKREEVPAPSPVHVPPHPSNQHVQQEKQNPSTRPQKKKKPRIAANLPFQMD